MQKLDVKSEMIMTIQKDLLARVDGDADPDLVEVTSALAGNLRFLMKAIEHEGCDAKRGASLTKATETLTGCLMLLGEPAIRSAAATALAEASILEEQLLATLRLPGGNA